MDDFDGRAAHAARPIQLALTKNRTFDARGQKQQRIGADYSDDGAELSALHVLFLDDAAMMRRRGADTDAIFVEYLIAVGADVDVAAVRIAHDVDARGADEASAVFRVPNRRGESREINLGVTQNVFLYRAALDGRRWNRRKAFKHSAPEVQQTFMGRVGGIDSQGHSLPFAGAHTVGKDAV